MSGDTAEQGGTELLKTDTMVVAGGGQQATMSSPPSQSLNGGDEEPEKTEKPVVEFQNDPCSDGEEELCRICRIPGEEERPLYYPCACSGSMKFAHEECLLQWLKYRNIQRGLDDKQCEICKHAFAFHFVYAENTPSRLTLLELKAARWMRFHTGLLIFISMWLLVIPVMAAWQLRFISVRISGEAELFISIKCPPGPLLVDWFCGISFLGGLYYGLDYGLLSNLVGDIIFERLRELWRQRGRAGRQLVVEVDDPLRGPVWVLEEINCLVIKQAMATCVLCLLVLAQVIFPSSGRSLFLVANSARYQYTWLGCIGVAVLWYRQERVKRWLSDLHNSIKDDRYLIKRLQKTHNLERTHEKSDCLIV